MLCTVTGGVGRTVAMTCIGHKRYSVLQGLSWRFQPGVVRFVVQGALHYHEGLL
jgi:hypothetical protein